MEIKQHRRRHVSINVRKKKRTRNAKVRGTITQHA